MSQILKSSLVLCIVSICLLWLNFTGHVLSTVSLDKYLDGEFESEGYAISRLVYNLEEGADAKGGFMVRYKNIYDIHKSTNRDDFKTFKENLNTDNMTVYMSHAGTQDDVFVPLWNGLTALKNTILEKARPGSRWEQRMQDWDLYYFILITKWVMALVNALVLSLLLLWVSRTWHNGIAYGTLAFMLIFMPVLTYYGQSVWWMMGSWFLPLMIALWGLHLRPNPKWFDLTVIGLFAAAAIALKVTMGYEFSSTVMMGVLIAPLFYAVKNRWSRGQTITALSIMGILGFFGFLAGLLYHWNALDAYMGDPMAIFEKSFTMRAYGNGTQVEGLIGESVDASPFSVIFSYLISPKELMPPQILLMAPFLWLLWQRRKELTVDRDFAALSIAIAAAFIGAVSMLVILKAHAYVHGYDVVVWSIPMNILLGIVYAREIAKRITIKL